MSGPGVSTSVWGPPLWRILHTIAFAHPEQLRANAHELIHFLSNLSHILPCKWCRDSYSQFLRQLPPLHQTITDGRMGRWMYDLHAMVNSKLGASTPKFESIVKRFTVRPVQWSPSDVWDTISLFGLNFTPAAREHYRVFWNQWPSMLRLATTDHRVADLIASTPCPCEDGGFIATCLVLESEFDKRPPPSPSNVARRTRRYMVARAQSGCANGVCE